MSQDLGPQSKEAHPTTQELFSSDEKTAINAYLEFSSNWNDPIMKEVVRTLREKSTATAAIFQHVDEGALLQHSRHTQDLLRAALANNDWKYYIDDLARQGVQYARAGLQFRDWIRILTLYRDFLHPYILKDYPRDTNRASLIWQGINKLGDLALEVVSRSYFDEKTKEREEEQLAKNRALQSLKKSEESLRELSEVLEEKVEERTAELRAINKELENFSYTVSHDLRAPLRAMGGYARILTKKAKDNLNEEQLRYLNVIIENVAKMGELIDDLLLYSRTGRARVNPSQIDMTRLVRDVFDEIIDPEEDLRVELKLEELPPAVGDWEMLKRVFANLLANAVKFSRHRERQIITVTGTTDKNELIYSMADNGAGFEMEYAHKLFGIFQRLHSEDEYEGTGVGLAIVQRIIHKHGGRVWAEGKLNEGACFYFSLPNK